MTFDPDKILKMPPIETVAQHNARDVILYALGVGVGIGSATRADTLRFVYEEQLSVLPTMAAVLASPGFWARNPRYGIDWKRVLHGEQFLSFHRPLPSEGTLASTLTIEDIYDKGADKGAVLLSRREIYDSRSGDHLATERRSSFLRGDGGKGGRRDASPGGDPIPNRPPDLRVSLPTRKDQALLYRLSGDYNPLHIDPDAARQAKFDVPILHGLCTYGVAGRALLTELAGGDVSKLRSMNCRFSSPVYPGETIVTEIWRLEGGSAAFQCRVAERDVLVLTRGRAEYKGVLGAD
jgi:acyl dehydratase